MIRLEIEGTPPSLNQWTTLHWSRQRQIKQDWAWLVKAACLVAKAGRPAGHGEYNVDVPGCAPA